MKKKKLLLFLSLAINAFLIGAILIMIIQQGEIGSVVNKIKGAESNQGFPDYHQQKKAIFEELDTEKADKIFLGDSITDHGEFSEYYPEEKVLNRGIAEDTTKGILDRIDEVVSRNPKELYIMIGVNDIAAGTSAKTYGENMKEIIHSFNPGHTRVIVQSILPVNTKSFNNNISNEKIHQFNEILKGISKDADAEYVDLHTYFEDQNGQLKKNMTIDGIHLKGNGYDLWIEHLANL